MLQLLQQWLVTWQQNVLYVPCNTIMYKHYVPFWGSEEVVQLYVHPLIIRGHAFSWKTFVQPKRTQPLCILSLEVEGLFHTFYTTFWWFQVIDRDNFWIRYSSQIRTSTGSYKKTTVFNIAATILLLWKYQKVGISESWAVPGILRCSLKVWHVEALLLKVVLSFPVLEGKVFSYASDTLYFVRGAFPRNQWKIHESRQ